MISKTTQRMLCAFTFGALALNTTPAWARVNTPKRNRTQNHYSFNLEALNEETAKFSETKNDISVYARRLRRNKRLRGIGGFEQIQLTIKNNNLRNQNISLDNIDLDLVDYQDITNRVESRRFWRSLGVGLLVGVGGSILTGFIGNSIVLSGAICALKYPFLGGTITVVGLSICVISPCLLFGGTPAAAMMQHSSMKTEDDRDIKYIFSEKVTVESDTDTSILLFVKKKNLEKNFDLTLVDQLGNKTTFEVAL